MITIEKKYHFYAAHRNENLMDKCSNLHGHTYYVTCKFEMLDPSPTTGVTVLFDRIDKTVEPIIKGWDHALLIHDEDPLLKYLTMFTKKEHRTLKIVVFDKPTSCENIAKELFELIYISFNRIVEISVQETTTSIVTYKP